MTSEAGAPRKERPIAHGVTHGVLLTIAYDGSAFSGWAAQRDTRTVEETVRGAIRALDPRADGPRGCSRTDAGVHARGQRAAFDATLHIPPRGWVLALNQHLPDDVSIRAAQVVPVGFHPRFASRMKRYRYALVFDKVRDPLLRNRAWRIGYEMDMAKMQREAAAIVGTHDFAAFRSAGDERDVTTRTIESVTVAPSPSDPHQWSIAFEGSAFLYNMVRILTGTLVDVARGHLPEGTIAKALASKNRGDAGQTAPAHGLLLEHIELNLPEGAGEAWPP
ncbi:tRNA pseudouridine synthase A [Labilithrix luteola]|uniref:tRNA pseudouridine synthase A n=1 Tax=Labilithrix luteola TaxID=1391654 RepID=A0A0K1PRL1_9BACT|nr:tRNA pseudouridine(38-40) synthase TruA [Labilithrix luteola]AKU96016.1 tRNA pseudouridine synthase A [Labilithrix luteola]